MQKWSGYWYFGSSRSSVWKSPKNGGKRGFLCWVGEALRNSTGKKSIVLHQNPGPPNYFGSHPLTFFSYTICQDPTEAASKRFAWKRLEQSNGKEIRTKTPSDAFAVLPMLQFQAGWEHTGVHPGASNGTDVMKKLCMDFKRFLHQNKLTLSSYLPQTFWSPLTYSTCSSMSLIGLLIIKPPIQKPPTS